MLEANSSPPTTFPVPPPPSPPPTTVPEPGKQPDNPWKIPQLPEKQECPKCGVVLDRITMYSCNKSGCPIFIQISCVSSET